MIHEPSRSHMAQVRDAVHRATSAKNNATNQIDKINRRIKQIDNARGWEIRREKDVNKIEYHEEYLRNLNDYLQLWKEYKENPNDYDFQLLLDNREIPKPTENDHGFPP